MVYYKCLSKGCNETSETYEAAKDHAKEKGHPSYKKIMIDSLKLNNETKEKLIKVYTTQTKFAIEIAGEVSKKIIEELPGLSSLPNEIKQGFIVQLSNSVIDKILPPAVYAVDIPDEDLGV
ncbi:MAG: hypothetical protein JRN67_05190 [Nitrososphaerota archaeon]|nr:hypothetical protein [Nitrososphaerota archaeon]